MNSYHSAPVQYTRAQLLLQLFVVLVTVPYGELNTCSGPAYTYMSALSETIAIRGPCPVLDPSAQHIAVPDINITVQFRCTFDFGLHFPYWIVTGREPLTLVVNSSPSNSSISVSTDLNDGVTTLSVSVEKQYLDEPLNIRCGLCTSDTNCYVDPIISAVETENVTLIIFGPPHSLSHKIQENKTVLLNWSSPSLPPQSVSRDYTIPFQYSITIVSLATTPATVLTAVTNATSITLTTDDILNYTECTQYSWGVSAGTVLYGYTDISLADNNFTFISAPNVSDELIIDESLPSMVFINFNMTTDDDLSNYNYTLLQRDYCGAELNSSYINVTSSDTVDISSNDSRLVYISVNITSLIDNLTWAVAVEVTRCLERDSTLYTNLTTTTGTVPQCGEPIMPAITSSLEPVSTTTNEISSSIDQQQSTTPSFSTTPSSITTVIPSMVPQSNDNSVLAVVGAVVAVVLVLIGAAVILLCIFCCIRTKKTKVDAYHIRDVTDTDTVSYGSKTGKVDITSISQTPPVDEENTQTTAATPHIPMSIDPTYQSPQEAASSHSSKENLISNYAEPFKSPSAEPDVNPTYATPHVKAAVAVAMVTGQESSPLRVSLKSPMEGVVDTPGYSEVINTRKTKRSARSPKSPLPSTPTDISADADATRTHDGHMYADINEINPAKASADVSTSSQVDQVPPTTRLESVQTTTALTYAQVNLPPAATPPTPFERVEYSEVGGVNVL